MTIAIENVILPRLLSEMRVKTIQQIRKSHELCGNHQVKVLTVFNFPQSVQLCMHLIM